MNDVRAWELFLHTGKISDYMRYRQALCSKPEDEDFIGDEEYPDADYDAGIGDRNTGY